MALNVNNIKIALRRLLKMLFSEAALVEEITYKLSTGVAFDETAGRNVAGYEDTTMNAINIEKRYARVILQDNLPLATNNLTYLLRAEDCPDGMSSRDKVIAAGRTRQVSEIRPFFGVAFGLVLAGDN